MKNLFKPASLLLYLLTIPTFFLAGSLYAALSGAAKGQGLAGGAIVFGYGVVFALVAFVVSVFLAFYLKPELIVKTNRILVIVLTIAAGIIVYRFMSMERKETPIKTYPSTKTTPEAIPLPKNSVNSVRNNHQKGTNTIGSGFFKPDFYNHSVLYFYGNPNFEKSLPEHPSTDSIVFNRLKHGNFDIAYAPPWLVPAHLKLDYEILYFRILSIGRDFIKVIVNIHTQRIMYVSRTAGEIIYWADFLLNVNSVEFIKGREQIIRYKPSHQAGEVNCKFQFMKPLQVNKDWMQVQLVDANYKTLDTGWIQWKNNEELLITYSLLS